jgi:DNA-binding GntR family transcriptional regulator
VTSYQRVADSIRRRLLDGHWRREQQLPTERELCEQFGVSQITVRRAMQILEEEHLIERRQGIGTFATSAGQRKIPILNTDFFGSIRRHAPRLERRLDCWERTTVGADLVVPLRACLGDPVLLAVRVDYLQGTPVTTDEVAIVGRFADRVRESDLADLDFVRRWQTVQKLRLTHCDQTIEAVKAKSPVAGRLQVRAGEPLLKETSLIFTSTGEPAGMFVSHYRHDSFRFTVTFDFAAKP